MKRTASAHWAGGLKDGKGSVTTQSGVLKDTQYSFSTRFEDGIGTNPEELIAAAHAGCFSMATSGGLTRAGFPPTSIATTASVNLESTPAGFRIARIDLVMEAVVPGVAEEQFKTIAEEAKKGCPVSVALSAVPITLSATLKK